MAYNSGLQYKRLSKSHVRRNDGPDKGTPKNIDMLIVRRNALQRSNSRQELLSNCSIERPKQLRSVTSEPTLGGRLSNATLRTSTNNKNATWETNKGSCKNATWETKGAFKNATLWDRTK
eukprot:scaffold11287_cov98-Cylindrotheca_fusiformis.AAC.1